MKRTVNAAMLAAILGMPAGLGQQTEIATKPGSGVVRVASRPPRPKRTPEQIAKHAAKLYRRYQRWTNGLTANPCVSYEQFLKILGDA